MPFQVNLDMARLAVPGMDLGFNALFGQLEQLQGGAGPGPGVPQSLSSVAVRAMLPVI